MRKYTILASLAVSVFFLLTGCSCSNSNPPFKATRIVELHRQVSQGGTAKTLIARASNGHIIAYGLDDASNLDVKATITARGWDQAEADNMAAGVVVSINENGLDYIIDVQKPGSDLSRYINLSYDITAPKYLSMDLNSSNGKIQVFDFDSPVKAHTSNGSILLKNVTTVTNLGSSNGSITTEKCIGPSKVRTSNGSITYRNFDGDLEAETSNGRITAEFIDTVKEDFIIDAKTSNASVNIKLPFNFGGQVQLTTSNGSINCERPVLTQGNISKSSLKGKIGEGNARLTVRTSNGSITVK